MKLKFKQQQYQDDAVMSVVNCFIGQEKSSKTDYITKYIKSVGKGFLKTSEDIVSYGNSSITLTKIERRKNIRNVQRLNDINYTDNEDINNLTIEMETGTGKTYTYIKTMYELNEHYGWSKFVVMVPSIAIREGIQKSFEITEEHFQTIYHKKIRFFVYNSAKSSNIANINTFVSDNTIQVMIINYQAFSARGVANRRIYEELDELQSKRPIDVIKSVRPILIIDEPQKFGDKTERLFSEFNPLFTIRYSATHKKNKQYNKIYRLDAMDAYNQKLVKKINVKGLEILHNKSKGAYLFLDSVDVSQKNDPVAILEIDIKTTTGTKRQFLRVKSGDDLYIKSGHLTSYKGYVVREIDARHEKEDIVYFTNGNQISSGQIFGNIAKEQLDRIQIRETIHSHFEKEKELYKLGIKVLSLFFIDEVAKYKYYDDGKALKGEYARIFEEEYNKALLEYQYAFDDNYMDYLNSFDTGKIHAGYFSIDKKGKVIEPQINDKKEFLSFDENAYELIMKDKERLLSLEEPVRFIFSHSALREGWDNPNIFQICTLKHNNSEISKRQEIGRGLRICVNNDGERMDYKLLGNDFHSINTLTVVASESYEEFAEKLQNEMLEALSDRPKNFVQESFIGKEIVNEDGEKYIFTSEHYQDLLLHNIENGYVDRKNNYRLTDKFIEDLENNQLDIMEDLIGFEEEFTELMKKLYAVGNVELIHDERKENIKSLIPNSNFTDPIFQELWHNINAKTIYEVNFDTEMLIKKAIERINKELLISRMKVKITEGTQKDTISSMSLNSKEAMVTSKTRIEVIDDTNNETTTAYDLIGEITRDTALTRKTIIEILKGIHNDKFNMYKNNPEEFIRKISILINEEKAEIVIDGIKYKKINKKYSDDIFKVNHVCGKLGENAIEVTKSIYDFLVTDSKVEMNFAKQLEAGEVKVYAKLPSKFKIPTPVGNYSPDWAIALDNKKFFIAETKGNIDLQELRSVEKAKTRCAEKHFECICKDAVKYGVVDNYDTLMDMSDYIKN